MRLFCWHKWHLIATEAVEERHHIGYTTKTDYFSKPVTHCTFQCTKCGWIKQKKIMGYMRMKCEHTS